MAQPLTPYLVTDAHIVTVDGNVRGIFVQAHDRDEEAHAKAERFAWSLVDTGIDRETIAIQRHEVR